MVLRCVRTMVALWEYIVVISILGSAVTGVWFVYQRTTEIQRTIQEWVTPDVVEGIFGPNAGVVPVSDFEFENLIKEHADDAKRTIDRISVHMYTVDKQETQQFRNPNVRHRILLLKPTTDGEAGKRTGFETDIFSPYDEDAILDQDAFNQPFSYIYNKIDAGEWKNVEVRVYETTPWLRCAMIDERYAGVIFVPTVQGGREAQKFWTDNPDTVQIFTDIFEDIWTDKRTTDFVSWYEEWDVTEHPA